MPENPWTETPHQEGSETVERQLAQFAFIREERDREVRLSFRDVSPADLAKMFLASGASFISLTGERASTQPDDEEPASPADESVEPRPHRRRKVAQPTPQTGEPTLLYFYALGDLLYTVSVTSSSGVVPSIAGFYPAAALSESELQGGLEVFFR
jgi:hypothetical protein